MKEHFQLFSAPMVLAILAGTKDMTRRLVTPENSLIDGKSARTREGKALWAKLNWKGAIAGANQWVVAEKRKRAGKALTHLIDPYVRTGDTLIGKETHYLPLAGRRVRYRADDMVRLEDGSFSASVANEPRQWRPSIFMPKWASRLSLEVTCSFAQRLQSISVMDCLREGLERRQPSDWKDMAPGFAPPRHVVYRDYLKEGEWIESPAASYKSLWNMLNIDPGTRWEDNPPVWVRAFRSK